MTYSIRHIFHIESSIKNVKDCITQISLLKKWWTNEITGSESVGSKLLFQFGEFGFIEVRILEIQNTYIKWQCTNAHPEWIGTKIEFKLTKIDTLVQVDFIHSGWESQTDFYATCNHSWGKYFISMKNLLEKGQGEPFTN